MDNELNLFCQELHWIQSDSVNIMLCNVNNYDEIEDMLTDFSYNLICRIMELLDGCRNENLKYHIVNSKNNAIINLGHNLHDLCEDFLNSTDI